MTKSAKWTAALLALGLGTTAVRAAEPTQQDLMAQLDALKAKVSQLEQNQNRVDSRDIDATVAAVLKDASTHSLLVDGTGVNAGWDKKRGQFFLGSEDGSYYIHPGVIFQFRYVANSREHAKTGGDYDTQDGFENTRVKPYFEGNLWGKDISYKFQWATAKIGGTLVLDDAWGAFTFAHGVLGGDLAVRAGQFKNPVVKEETTGDQNQLGIERSYLNQVLGGGFYGPRTQGAEIVLTGNENPLHAELLYSDGNGQINSDFRNFSQTTTTAGGITTTTNSASTNFGVATRVDYKVFGNWADDKQFSAKGDPADLLVFGGGAALSQGDHVNAYTFSADVKYNIGGKISLYAAFIDDYQDFRNQGGPGSRNDYGILAQVGYLFTPAFEMYGRYGYIRFDKNFATGGVKDFHEITAGLNYYLGENGSAGNHAKVSVDLTYLPNGAPKSDGNSDVLSQGGKNDEFILRAQLQLAI